MSDIRAKTHRDLTMAIYQRAMHEAVRTGATIEPVNMVLDARHMAMYEMLDDIHAMLRELLSYLRPPERREP